MLHCAQELPTPPQKDAVNKSGFIFSPNLNFQSPITLRFEKLGGDVHMSPALRSVRSGSEILLARPCSDPLCHFPSA
jgi:hypothetical protein